MSFPGVFKSIEAFDSLWFTGSSIYENDVMAPIIHCAKLGYSQEDTVIDVILSGSPHLDHEMSQYYNAFAIGERTLQIMQYYDRMFGVLRAKAGHPRVDYRNIIGPQREMPSKIIPMGFTRHEVEVQIKLGMKDAREYTKAKKEMERED